MKEDISVLSTREIREWIPSCPVRLTSVRTIKDGEKVCAVVVSYPCTERKIKHFNAVLTFTDIRKQPVGGSVEAEIAVGESEPVEAPADAVYGSAYVKSVAFADGEISEFEGQKGTVPPEQEVYWSNDPLYDALRLECAGVVEPSFRPDAIPGGKRCACGRISLPDEKKCSCGCEFEWLETHLETAHLEEVAKRASENLEKDIIRERKKSNSSVSDIVKASLILAALAVAVIGTILTIKVFIPNSKISKAVSLADVGEYDEALSILSSLGDYKNARALYSDTSYRKAQSITGLEEVNMTTNAKSPWFTIDENGVLSFNKDKYEDKVDEWNNFVVPDVVDGIIVRELDRNFFINCKKLTVVTISDCVEVIGEQAFYNCESLFAVNFGKSTRVIGPRAFINCYALETIEIPDTVESLGLRAFNNCTSLKKAVLGAGITSIGAYTFSLCSSLDALTVLSPITSIGEYAFSECNSLKTIFCRFDGSMWVEPEVAEGNEVYDGIKISFNN